MLPVNSKNATDVNINLIKLIKITYFFFTWTFIVLYCNHAEKIDVLLIFSKYLKRVKIIFDKKKIKWKYIVKTYKNRLWILKN